MIRLLNVSFCIALFCNSVRRCRALSLVGLFAVSFGITTAEGGPDLEKAEVGWKELLLADVTLIPGSSTVNYQAIKKAPEKLKSYTAELGKVSKAEFEAYSREARLAFLINAYNAFTIEFIVDNYPVKSIKDLGSLFSSPWKKKKFSLFGRNVSLDEIEHEMVRPVFREPRIHFAMVCASKGCPGLRNEPYTAEKLEAQLEDSTRKFLTDTTRNRFDREKKRLELSSIFKWYKDDFVTSKGSVATFVAPYMATTREDQQAILDKNLRISHLDYDWTLNGG